MASGKWLVASALSLLVAVQVVYAKKDKSAKDTTNIAIVVEVAKDTVKAVEIKEETVVKVDGILEVGFDNKYKYRDKSGNDKKENEYKRIGRAEVGISMRPVKKVRAEMGFEYNSKDSLPTIDKLYGQYSPLNFSTIRFGYMKKSFGLEEKTGLDERYFHKRSIIDDTLEYFGFLDHDLTLQYRHEFGKELELRGGFSWTADSSRYLQNYSVEYDDKKNNLILAAIIRHQRPHKPPPRPSDLPPELDTTKYDMRTTFVSSLSYKRIDKLFASELELIYGTNPAIKREEDRNAFIFGARWKENFLINTSLSTLQQVIPVAEAVYFSNDFKEDDFDMQFRAGLTLGFAKKSAFQWRNNYGVVYKVKDDKKKLWQRRFDSEVVVVF